MHPARPGWLQACSRAPLASSGSGVGGLFSLALPPSLGSQAVPPTSAALWALGGSLFRGHKAPLILCSAPSHVTRWAGRALRRPAQPVAAAGVSPPLPLFLAASHRRRGASGGAAAPGLPEGTATGPRAASPRAPPPAAGGPLRVPGRGAVGARSPRGAQIFGCGAEERGFVRPQLSLCKYLASSAEWLGPPPAGSFLEPVSRSQGASLTSRRPRAGWGGSGWPPPSKTVPHRLSAVGAEAGWETGFGRCWKPGIRRGIVGRGVGGGLSGFRALWGVRLAPRAGGGWDGCTALEGERGGPPPLVKEQG